MSVVNLYNGIYKILANDDVILNLLGITNKTDNLKKAKQIKKRSNPPDIINNLPVISFYSPGGGREVKNNDVYGATFVFDIYTKDDVDLALNISQRLMELFDGKLNSMFGVESLESEFVEAYESKADLQNTYCFTLVFSMFVTLDC
jgi:hypothetical protein